MKKLLLALLFLFLIVGCSTPKEEIGEPTQEDKPDTLEIEPDQDD